MALKTYGAKPIDKSDLQDEKRVIIEAQKHINALMGLRMPQGTRAYVIQLQEVVDDAARRVVVALGEAPR